MPQLLFEIGVEELPALAIDEAASFMKSYLSEAFNNEQLYFSGIKTFGTPRRLCVLVDELASLQEDVEEELLGPSAHVAFDETGKLSKAGLGFVKAKSLDEKKIYRKQTDKGEVIASIKIKAGRSTKEILPQLLVDMMRKIPFKKRMRWESSGESFARPVRWLVCLFDGEYLPITFADVSAAEFSRGHRFMSPEVFRVTSNEQYLRELAARFVVLSSDEREAMFIKGALKKLEPLHTEFRNDPSLMAIVRNLVEYPFVILGSFEKKYLDIPSEILICEMKAHQKCFAVYDRSGSFLPHFICGAGTKPFDEEFFAKGNARVLRARFEDGAFYYGEDRKKTLAEHASGLANLVFERDLGTVLEKSERILKVALGLSKLIDGSPKDIDLIKESAPLLKADLTTGVVGQFPELQGVMGRIYAKLDGRRAEICEIIETHYWPRFAEDNLPKLKAASILSIADKLDTLVGIIAVGKRPVGNKDPFGLRRAAIAIVRMLVHFGFSVDLGTMISLSLHSYGERFLKNADQIIEQAKDFVIQRARGLLVEDLGKENKEYAVNFADSVLSAGANDLLDAFARAHTLYAMRNKSKDEFDSLVQAFKRASNIVKKAEGSFGPVVMDQKLENILSSAVEKDLLSSVRETKNLIGHDIDKRAGFDALRMIYSDIFSKVAMIKPKLDAFFDHVMVMVEDSKMRNARLALLSEIKGVADKVADFTHL